MLSPTNRTFGTVLLSTTLETLAQKGEQSHELSQQCLQCEHACLHVAHAEHLPVQRPLQHCSPPYQQGPPSTTSIAHHTNSSIGAVKLMLQHNSGDEQMHLARWYYNL